MNFITYLIMLLVADFLLAWQVWSAIINYQERKYFRCGMAVGNLVLLSAVIFEIVFAL